MTAPVVPSLQAAMLGATLYLPAIRDDLIGDIGRAQQAGARSLVLCLEDSLRSDEVEHALANLRQLLARNAQSANPGGGPAMFIRPRNPAMLAHIAMMPGIGAVTGFVLPKITADSLPRYLALLEGQPFLLMPTLETREALDPIEMRRLRDQLMAIQDRVLALRIGGNDLLQLLGTRRSPHRTAYDGPLGSIIHQLAAGFIPWGFAMSAPVFENFGNDALLLAEVERDLEAGLITKTAIHPGQISVIHRAYAVSPDDLAAASTVMDTQARGVYSSGRIMQEPATHRGWAERIIERARIFGIAEQKETAE